MSRINDYLTATAAEKRDPGVIAFLAGIDQIEGFYPEIAHAIIKELHDQRTHLKLIASENFCSLTVQQAMANLLTDKYSEGYPYHRFYAGCDNVDTVEAAAVDQLKKLYGCEHAYVQPHSGADANLVAFWAILFQRVQTPELERLGVKSVDALSDADHETMRQLMLSQKVMGMSLNSGGHLTHGYRLNISSKIMQATSYEVDFDTGFLDYAQVQKRVKEEKPNILLAGYSAYPRNINCAKMREIADSVGAVFMVDMAHFSGLVAGKVLTGEFDPIPYADIVTSTTHKTLRGPRGGMILCKEEYGEMVDKGCPLVLGGPMPHVMAAKAIAFKEASSSEFQTYAGRIVDNARALAENLLRRDARLLTGGTDNHQVLVDVSGFGLTGRQAELALREAGITVNRNAIPCDKNGPWITSGIRLGTPALTTLGMGADEMAEIADLIVDTLENTKPTIVAKTGKPSRAKSVTDPTTLDATRSRAVNLLRKHPLYPQIPLLEPAVV